MKMSKKDLDKYMSMEDARKVLDRKERIQHPHMIKSRSHWDWDLGYDVEKKIQ